MLIYALHSTTRELRRHFNHLFFEAAAYTEDAQIDCYGFGKLTLSLLSKDLLTIASAEFYDFRKLNQFCDFYV